MLLHLIYASFAAKGFAGAALSDMVARSKIKNERQGITAVLLHQRGAFLHGVEGEADDVRRLFAWVCADPRHCDARVLVKTEVTARLFAGQPMSFHDADLAPLKRTTDDAKPSGVCVSDPGFSWQGCVALQLLTPYRS